LALFVLGSLANHMDDTVSPHDLAVGTYLFYGGADFHSLFQTFKLKLLDAARFFLW
jgi:hypothetical protein